MSRVNESADERPGVGAGRILARRSSPLAHWPVWARIVVGTAAGGATALITNQLRLEDAGSRFLLAYPVVFGASYLGGRFAGYAATLTFGLLFGALQVERWTGSVNEWAQAATLLLFIGIGVAAAKILSRLKSANRAAEIANAELARSRDEARAAHEQTDLLLRELRHRVKNDIANAVSLLRLQAKVSDPAAVEPLDTAAARLMVLARVHERLSRQGHRPVVSMASFLESLCTDLKASMFGVRPIGLETGFDDFEAPSDEAVAVGLVVNELLTNAAKYAFAGMPGTIRLHVVRDGNGSVEIMIADDGCGFNPEAVNGGLGEKLVRSLVAQLGGDFSIESSESGTVARVRYRTSRPEGA